MKIIYVTYLLYVQLVYKKLPISHPTHLLLESCAQYVTCHGPIFCVSKTTRLCLLGQYYLYAHHVAYTVEPMTRTVIIYCLALNIWYKKLNFACRSEVGV